MPLGPDRHGPSYVTYVTSVERWATWWSRVRRASSCWFRPTFCGVSRWLGRDLGQALDEIETRKLPRLGAW